MAEKLKNSMPVRLNLRLKDLNRTLFMLSLPSVIENCLYSLVFMVDAMIVGWLRNQSFLAASALSGSIMFLMNAPFIALSVSAGSIVARSWGEKDYEAARKHAGQSLSIAFMGVTFLAIVFSGFAGKILELFGAESQVVEVGDKYMQILLISCIGGLPMMVSNGILRAMGDSARPMWITGIMNIINIPASIALAFGYLFLPKLGFYGVAWGTVIARSVGVFLSVGQLMRQSSLRLQWKHFLPFERIILGRIWYLAAPAVIERTATSVSYIFFTAMVAKLGTTLLAAHNIAMQIESIAFMPAWGLVVATNTITGQAIGAKVEHIAEIAVKRLIFTAGGIMLILGGLFAILGPQIVKIFGSTPDVLEPAGHALQIAAIELPFLVITFIFMGALRGAGDTRSPLYVSLSSTLIMRLGGVYLLSFVFHMGLIGVWLATAMDWMARSAGLGYFFNKGVWKLLHQKEKEKFQQSGL